MTLDPSSRLVRFVDQVIRAARTLRLLALPPQALACVVCGTEASSLRACERCASAVAYTTPGYALALRPGPKSGPKPDGRKHRRCSRCGGSDGHDRRTCTAEPMPPRGREVGRYSTSPSAGARITCRCPGHDGTTVDLAALSAWIEHGCVLHDTRTGDRTAARRGVDGLVGPQVFGESAGVDGSEAA